jgi:hypothetical protein
MEDYTRHFRARPERGRHHFFLLFLEQSSSTAQMGPKKWRQRNKIFSYARM